MRITCNWKNSGKKGIVTVPSCVSTYKAGRSAGVSTYKAGRSAGKAGLPLVLPRFLQNVQSQSFHGKPSITKTPFQLKGSDWMRLTKSRQEQVVELAFQFWRKHGFPYYELTG